MKTFAGDFFFLSTLEAADNGDRASSNYPYDDDAFLAEAQQALETLSPQRPDDVAVPNPLLFLRGGGGDAEAA